MDIIFVRRGSTEYYKSFEEIPYKVRGYSEDLSELRAQGRCVHRAELDNKPEYEGFIGPMWDGGRFRYETQEVYDILSM
ncbi:MAG: hypothetical protein IKP50_00395 [Bacilli bacterium]|nr:hypothetical protein [Bacilli bacterium]